MSRRVPLGKLLHMEVLMFPRVPLGKLLHMEVLMSLKSPFRVSYHIWRCRCPTRVPLVQVIVISRGAKDFFLG